MAYSQNQKDQVKELQIAYLNAMTHGSKEIAHHIVNAAIATGMNVLDIYQNIFEPTLKEIGRLWREGTMSIAIEHKAIQITHEEMGRLRGMIQPKGSNSLKVFITTLPGDYHGIDAQMISDFFYADGWDSDFIGTNTPLGSIEDYIEEAKPDLILFSLSIPDTIHSAIQICKHIRSLEKRIPIILSGRIFPLPDDIQSEIKADAFILEPHEATKVGIKLISTTKSPETFEDLLNLLGKNIREERNRLGFSQQELAQSAELDRAYISSLENGKKNISLASLFRLADALEVDIRNLLS